ncbi:MAG: hypothetical protein ACLRIS_14150 [Flavonifractor plautii]
MQEAELTYIEGTVDAVIYQNQENGYTVLRLDAGRGGGSPLWGACPAWRRGEHLGSGDMDAPRLLRGAVQGRGGGAADARGHQGHL